MREFFGPRKGRKTFFRKLIGLLFRIFFSAGSDKLGTGGYNYRASKRERKTIFEDRRIKHK